MIDYILDNWESQKINLCFSGYRKVFDNALMSSYEMSLGLTMNNKSAIKKYSIAIQGLGKYIQVLCSICTHED